MSGDHASESQLRRPDAPKPQVGSPARRSPLWGVVMALLLLGWLVAVPRLAFRAVITSSTFLGESPSVEDVRNSEHLMAWAAVLAVILPATGLIVGLWLGARVMSWVFGGAGHRPGVLHGRGKLGQLGFSPSPIQRNQGCQEYSGGVDTCPGAEPGRGLAARRQQMTPDPSHIGRDARRLGWYL